MSKPSLWERYLTKEIGIEFKACLYFYALLFFYCVYRVCVGNTVAEILHMAEMIFLTYIVGYLQVYLLWNFDESDHLGKKEMFGIAVGTAIYTAVSYFCGCLTGMVMLPSDLRPMLFFCMSVFILFISAEEKSMIKS